MQPTVHRPVKIIAFKVNGIGRQAHEAGNQLQGLKIDTSVFSEIHLKPRMRFCIPNYDPYQTGSEDRHRGGTLVAVKKGIPHTCVDLHPLLSLEATGVCILIGNTEIFLAALCRHLRAIRF
jgi:hypothetical protein